MIICLTAQISFLSLSLFFLLHFFVCRRGLDSLYFEDNYRDVKLDKLIIWLDLSGGVFLIYGLIFQEEYFNMDWSFRRSILERGLLCPTRKHSGICLRSHKEERQQRWIEIMFDVKVCLRFGK